MKLDLTGVKGALASALIILSLIIGVLNAVQGALPPTVETLGTTNFNSLELDGTLKLRGDTFTGAVVGFGTDAVNGTMVAHGLSSTPTYPNCMVYNAGFVTVTAQISAANATSVTFRLFDAAGLPYSGAALAVRCTAIAVP